MLTKGVPLFRLSKFLGVFPTDSRRPKICLLVYSCSLSIIAGLLNAIVVLGFRASKDKHVVIFVELLPAVNFSLICTSHAVLYARNWRLLEPCLFEIIPLYYKPVLVYASKKYLLTITMILCAVCVPVLVINNEPSVWTKALTTNGQFFASYLIAMQFVSFLEIIRRLIVHNMNSFNSYESSSIRLIESSLRRHRALLRAAQNLARFYSFQMLFILLTVTVFFTQRVFFVYMATRKRVFDRAARFFFSGLTCFVAFYFPCQSIERFNEHARKFSVTLYRKMRQHKALAKNKRLQLYAGAKSTIHFTACGFFTLGYPLIISSSATFLVVLVQLSNS